MCLCVKKLSIKNMNEIKELVLKVPGLSGDEGRRLGEDVAQRIAARLPEGAKDRYIGELNVQLSFAPNTGREQMSESIANQIIQQLGIAYL